MRENIEDKEKCLEKLNQMQKYLPFLDFMIDKIEKKNHLECQLGKFQLLRSMIAEKNGKYTWEVIVKVEDVIQKLISKLGYKGHCVKSKEGVKERSKTKSSPGLTGESKEADARTSMAASLTIIPSSTTTTISLTKPSSSQVTTVSSKPLDSSSSTLDSVSKKSTLPTGSHRERPRNSERGKEFLSASLGPSQSLEENPGKHMEMDLDKDLDGFDLVDCPKMSEAHPSSVSGGSNSGNETDKLHSGGGFPSPSLQKLSESSQKKNFPCKSERRSPQSSQSKVSEKGSESHASAFGQTRTQTNPGERKAKSDLPETGRGSDLEKAHVGSGKPRRKSAPCGAGSSDSPTGDGKSRADSEAEANLKQKLMKKFSAEICELYKVSGKSLGGSLRSLKEAKHQRRKSVAGEEADEEEDDAEEEELLRRDKATEAPDSRKTSRSKSADGKAEKSRRDSSPNKSNKTLEKSSGKGGEKSSKEGAKEEKPGKGCDSGCDKKESKNSEGAKKSSKGEIELDNLSDGNLLELVKENVQSLPHLSRMKPVEPRKSLAPEPDDKNSPEGFGDLDEFMNVVSDLTEKIKLKTIADALGPAKGKSNETRDSHAKASESGCPEKGSQAVEKHRGVGGGKDDAAYDEGLDDEDYAQRLIEETTPQTVQPAKKKGLLGLPMPKVDVSTPVATLGEEKVAATSHAKPSMVSRDPRRRHSDGVTRPGKPESSSQLNPCSNRATSNLLPLPHFGSTHKDLVHRAAPSLPPQNLPADGFARTVHRGIEQKADSWHLQPISNLPCQNLNMFPRCGSNRFLKESHPGSFPQVTPPCNVVPPRRTCYQSEPKSYAEYKRMKLEKQRLSLQESTPTGGGLEDVNVPDTSRLSAGREEEQQSTSNFSEKRKQKQVRPVPSGTNPKGYNPNSANRSADDKRQQGQKKFAEPENKLRDGGRENKNSHGEERRKKIGADKRQSSDAEDVVSPLDKLYEGESKAQTGRGYGIQNFKIPKKVRDTPSGFKSNENQGASKDGADWEDWDAQVPGDSSKPNDNQGAQNMNTDWEDWDAQTSGDGPRADLNQRPQRTSADLEDWDASASGDNARTTAHQRPQWKSTNDCEDWDAQTAVTMPSANQVPQKSAENEDWDAQTPGNSSRANVHQKPQKKNADAEDWDAQTAANNSRLSGNQGHRKSTESEDWDAQTPANTSRSNPQRPQKRSAEWEDWDAQNASNSSKPTAHQRPQKRRAESEDWDAQTASNSSRSNMHQRPQKRSAGWEDWDAPPSRDNARTTAYQMPQRKNANESEDWDSKTTATLPSTNQGSQKAVETEDWDGQTATNCSKPGVNQAPQKKNADAEDWDAQTAANNSRLGGNRGHQKSAECEDWDAQTPANTSRANPQRPQKRSAEWEDWDAQNASNSSKPIAHQRPQKRRAESEDWDAQTAPENSRSNMHQRPQKTDADLEDWDAETAANNSRSGVNQGHQKTAECEDWDAQTPANTSRANPQRPQKRSAEWEDWDAQNASNSSKPIAHQRPQKRRAESEDWDAQTAPENSRSNMHQRPQKTDADLEDWDAETAANNSRSGVNQGHQKTAEGEDWNAQTASNSSKPGVNQAPQKTAECEDRDAQTTVGSSRPDANPTRETESSVLKNWDTKAPGPRKKRKRKKRGSKQIFVYEDWKDNAEDDDFEPHVIQVPGKVDAKEEGWDVQTSGSQKEVDGCRAIPKEEEQPCVSSTSKGDEGVGTAQNQSEGVLSKAVDLVDVASARPSGVSESVNVHSNTGAAGKVEAKAAAVGDPPRSCVSVKEKPHHQAAECDSGVESPSVTSTSSAKDPAPEKNTLVSKEEITQELVEALIRKSFQSGEGKLLLAQAKLFEEFTRKLNSKKLKTIQKIINSESGSSSSSSDSSSEDEKKKKKSKKSEDVVGGGSSNRERAQKNKRRKKRGRKSKKYVSSSESSESEENTEEEACEPTKKKEKSEGREIVQKPVSKSAPPAKTPAKGKKRRRGIDFGRCISRKRAKRKQGQKKLLEQILKEDPQQEVPPGPGEAPAKESEPKTRPKTKGKSKTELDRLHDDIRSMFISSGVVTATGQRMCRMLKESGGNMDNLDIVKESAKMVEEQKLRKVRTRTLRNPRRNANGQGSRSRSQSSDKGGLRDRSASRTRPLPELPGKQPSVILHRVDLNNFGLGVRISEDCVRFRTSRGQNRAIRGRRWRVVGRGRRPAAPPLSPNTPEPASGVHAENLDGELARNVFLRRNKRKYVRLKNKNCRKGYFGKRLADIVDKLPLKMAKMKHLEMCERKKQEKETMEPEPDPEPEPEPEPESAIPSQAKAAKKGVAKKSEKKWKPEDLKDTDLLDYAFEKKRSVYPCRLCSHVTRNITGHYTAVHPESEVLISRLCPMEAWKARTEAKDISAGDPASEAPESAAGETAGKRKQKPKAGGPGSYHCRMCTNPRITDVNAFFTHVTTHTGEYIFQCPAEGCPVKMSTRDYIKFHILTKHPKLRYQLYNKITQLFNFPVDGDNLYGFLCSECNFVQISRKNVENHVAKQHPAVEGVTIIKIDMCASIVRREKTPKGWQIIPQKADDSRGDLESEEEPDAVASENPETEGGEPKKGEDDQGEAKSPEVNEPFDGETTEAVCEKEEDVTAGDADDCDDQEETQAPEGEDCVDLKTISTIRGSDIIEPLENADRRDPSSKDPESRSSAKLKVGPLEAQLLENSVVLYECYVKGCLFSTKLFDLFEKHIKITHWKSKWDGKCEVCSGRGDSQVFPRFSKLLLALKHLKAHEREAIRDSGTGETERKLSKSSDECNDSDEESQEPQKDTDAENSNEDKEAGEVDDGQADKEEGPYPVKPLLRVRTLFGDRLSKQKGSVDEDEIVAIEESSGKESSVMFTIENVRSLKSDSDDVEVRVCPAAKADRDRPEKVQLPQGNPVVVRSCPTRKIAIRPEPGPLSIEVGHLNVVPAPVPNSLLLSPIPHTSPVRVIPSLSALRSPGKTKFSVQPIMVSASPFLSGSNVVSVIRSVTSTTATSSSLTYNAPAVATVEGDKGLPQTVVVPKTGVDGRKSPLKAASPTVHRPAGKGPSGSSSEREDAEQKDAKTLQRLHSRPDIKNKSVKDVKIYQEMLTKTKLCHLFKCMAVECSFTCNDEVVFTQHIGLHEAQRRMKSQKKGGKGGCLESGNKMKRVFNWQQCAYCCEVLVNTSSALSQHILTEHGHCIYQCAYCFYRAVSQSYVEIHQNLAHGQILKTNSRIIYKCKPLSHTPALASALEKHGRRQSVRPYHCDQCGRKFFITQEFMNHLVTEHVSVTAYTCHICKNLCFKADRLIVHYKLHSYCTYQCAYCLHGTETQKEMLFHLCNFHFSQPAYMYVRALADGQPGSDDVKKGPKKKKKSNSSQLDALKVVVYESDSLNPDCIVEADPEEDKGDEQSRDSPSLDFSSIVAELGINAESQSANVSPLMKELASIGNKSTENLTVKTLLPNAQFSSENENTGENCAVLISSGCSAAEQVEDKEMNIPLGQLPLEALNVQRRGNSPTSSLPRNIGSPDKNLKLNEIIVNLQNKDKSYALPSAEEETATESPGPKPLSAVHKLPPVVLSRSSCPKKVYPPKSGNVVKRKPEEVAQGGEASDGNTILYQILNNKDEAADPTAKNPSKEAPGEALPGKDRNAGDAHGQPLITSVVSLAGDASEERNSAEATKPPGDVASDLGHGVEKNNFSKTPEGNRKSQSGPFVPLEPPIIRVEDFRIEDDAASAEDSADSTKVSEAGSDGDVGSRGEKSGGVEPKSEIITKEEAEKTPPRSPDIIIIREGKSAKDIETVILDSEDEKDEKDEGVPEDRTDPKAAPDSPESTGVTVADDKIRKEMERLRKKMANETDSLLFDDAEDSKSVDAEGPLVVEPPSEDEASNASGLLSPIEKAISTLNKELQSDASEAKAREEEQKKDSDECKKSENVENVKPDLPRTRSGARMRKEEDGGEKSEDGKKDEFGRSRKVKVELTGLSGKELFFCGNDKCNFSAESDSLLKEHLYICDLSRESSMLVCRHCSKQFKHFHPYLEHIRYHGEKKYHCGLCSFSSPVDKGLSRHLKLKHKCLATKFLPKDPAQEGHFLGYPKSFRVDKNDEVNTYSPGDEDKLPLQSVYQVNVKCAQCPYFTKVRSNMVRHLKIHVKSVETEGVVVVPSTAPTNPVPCLEKKERMFDKMTNLAASSQLAQAKEKTAFHSVTAEEEAKLPQFVAEQMRYKCCLPDCNYITVDDGMLKHHIRALHDEINYYSCPHCKSTVHVDVRHVTLDKIGHHLKHHDSKLYKCPHCIYFHYQKSVVEKHLVEKHPERRYLVLTVREPKPEFTSEEEHSSNEGGVVTWKCGLCDEFQGPSKVTAMEHLVKSHNTRSKYKCQLCSMKSNTHQAFFGHYASKHVGEKVRYMRSMIKIISGNVESQSGNSSGADSSNEHFDTTPLWQRGAPRVRHIRGILIEEEEVKTKKCKRMSMETEPEGEVSEEVTAKENAFCCPLCSDKKKVFLTRNEDCFRSHLYQELNYQQFACILCGKMFVERKEYERHHARVHPEKPPALKQTKEDGEIMFWVDKVIAKQREEMQKKRRPSESGPEETEAPPKKKKEG